jgi:diphosphomevalonate decarboxylase
MWEASAPSNIALIKYMGKKADGNVPINSSLSWTLDYLRSFVQIEKIADGAATSDRWEPHPLFPNLTLTESGQEKFLNHFRHIKSLYSLDTHFFIVRSGNNFPADCGIASSASSFAALTVTAVKALESFHATKKITPMELAILSRQGSGSSCRSLFPGWVEWTADSIGPIVSRMNSLLHMVVIIAEEAKKVSSSKAHVQVKTSSLLRGRAERADERFEEFKQQVVASPPNWKIMYELAWADFWDMHALFETSRPPFGYMTAESLAILNMARELWEIKGDGPIVTMDAGPNVHLLWRADQKTIAQMFKAELAEYKIFSNLGDL